jgi:hypothetical protein
MISGEALDLLPPERETAVLSRPSLPGGLLKFFLSLPHALSIRLTDPAVEPGPLLTSLDVQFAISIHLDISKPQSKVVHKVVSINWAYVFLARFLDRFDGTQG